ncbi:MAG: cytochrome b [Hyphomicrobiales bacterium]|nr:MAG: cytochrome b [Hyphomicrobiales bacterium]
MNKNDPHPRWALGVRLLHWLTVLVLAFQVIVAFGPMKGPGMSTMNWLPVHMSVGVTILAVIVLRLGWRAFTKAPAQPYSRSWHRARTVFHMSIYALILAVLITGWLGYRPMPFMPPARLFGDLPVPLAPSVGPLSARAFAFIHAKLVWILLGLIGIHVAAALVHLAWFRDGVMRGMSFGRAGARSASEQ